MTTQCSSGSFGNSGVINLEIHTFNIITLKGVVYKKNRKSFQMLISAYVMKNVTSLMSIPYFEAGRNT